MLRVRLSNRKNYAVRNNFARTASDERARPGNEASIDYCAKISYKARNVLRTLLDTRVSSYSYNKCSFQIAIIRPQFIDF